MFEKYVMVPELCFSTMKLAWLIQWISDMPKQGNTKNTPFNGCRIKET